MRPAAPLRFVALLLGIWTSARLIVVYAPNLFLYIHLGAPAHAAAPAPLRVQSAPPAIVTTALPDTATPAPASDESDQLAVVVTSSRPGASSIRIALAPEPATATVRIALPAAAPMQLARDDAHPIVPEAPALSIALPPLPPAPGSHWSGSAWLFARGGDGPKAIGPGGEIGGSQAGARVAYRLDEAGRWAAFARGYAPLRRSGAEVSAGIEWHPLPRIPFRLAIERRQSVTTGGRSAWMASAAGGYYAEPLPGVLRLDGYAQAGIVGMRSHDLFADGSLRAGYPAKLGGGATLTLGGGVWGAVQPDAKRLDIGPQAALRVPVNNQTLTLAADYRFRVAGRAHPKSGPALTLGFDF